MYWQHLSDLSRLQKIKADLEICCTTAAIDKQSSLTFDELVELLKPLGKTMDFEKAKPREYRIDIVLGVHAVQATHISSGRFKVSGVHFQILAEGLPQDSLPVEVTLEADDETKAQEWVG